MPYINDWHSSSSGSWVGVILEGIFGLRPTLAEGITAKPQFGPLDAKAELLGLQYQGKRFGVNRGRDLSHGLMYRILLVCMILLAACTSEHMA